MKWIFETQVLMAASIYMMTFWGIALGSLAVDWRFRGAYHLYHQGGVDHDGGSRHLWNVSLLPDYSAISQRAFIFKCPTLLTLSMHKKSSVMLRYSVPQYIQLLCCNYNSGQLCGSQHIGQHRDSKVLRTVLDLKSHLKYMWNFKSLLLATLPWLDYLRSTSGSGSVPHIL
jgi:hypothetical protein